MANKCLTTDEFIKRAVARYGDKFDYSNTHYLNTITKITIRCILHDNIFTQTPKAHFKDLNGCVYCAKELQKRTNLKLYGVEYVLQSSEIREKIKQTNIELYGVENVFQSELIKKKSKQTNLERHGVEYPSQSNTIKERKKQTCLENYGVEYPIQSEEIRKKIKLNNLDRYGVEYPSQRHISNVTLSKLNDIEWLILQHHKYKKSITQISIELDVSASTVANRLKKYNIETKYFFRSRAEIELGEFVQSLGYVILTNNWNIIPPFEIDIFIPQLNIALEYNGLFWHQNKGTNYHKNKTESCAAQNIHLIHI